MKVVDVIIIISAATALIAAVGIVVCAWSSRDMLLKRLVQEMPTKAAETDASPESDSLPGLAPEPVLENPGSSENQPVADASAVGPVAESPRNTAGNSVGPKKPLRDMLRHGGPSQCDEINGIFIRDIPTDGNCGYYSVFCALYDILCDKDSSIRKIFLDRIRHMEDVRSRLNSNTISVKSIRYVFKRAKQVLNNMPALESLSEKDLVCIAWCMKYIIADEIFSNSADFIAFTMDNDEYLNKGNKSEKMDEGNEEEAQMERLVQYINCLLDRVPFWMDDRGLVALIRMFNLEIYIFNVTETGGVYEYMFKNENSSVEHSFAPTRIYLLCCDNFHYMPLFK